MLRELNVSYSERRFETRDGVREEDDDDDDFFVSTHVLIHMKCTYVRIHSLVYVKPKVE